MNITNKYYRQQKAPATTSTRYAAFRAKFGRLYAMNDSNIYRKLEKLRARFDGIAIEAIEQELGRVQFGTIQIDGIVFKSSAWLDQVGDEKLLILQLQQSGVLVSKNYCLGTKYSESGNVVYLTNEQLWEIGIP